MKYRDRAKERREKFGTPAVIPGWKKRLERELVKEQSVPYVDYPTNLGNTSVDPYSGTRSPLELV